MRAQSIVAGILAVLCLAGCANTKEAEAQPEIQDESAEQVQTETPRTSYEIQRWSAIRMSAAFSLIMPCRGRPAITVWA